MVLGLQDILFMLLHWVREKVSFFRTPNEPFFGSAGLANQIPDLKGDGHKICAHKNGYFSSSIVSKALLLFFWGCQLMGRKHEVNNLDLWLSLLAVCALHIWRYCGFCSLWFFSQSSAFSALLRELARALALVVSFVLQMEILCGRRGLSSHEEETTALRRLGPLPSLSNFRL